MILTKFSIIFIVFVLLNFGFAILKWVSDLENINLSSVKCDTFVIDTWYYSDEKSNYKFLLYDYKNEYNNEIYFLWKVFKIDNWWNLVDINYSILKKDWNILTGILLPNYSYLCKNNFAIKPNDKVRILTTAEEIWDIKCDKEEINSKMIYDWANNWIIFTDRWNDIKPGSFTFTNPVLKIIWHWKNIEDSLFFLKLLLLFDKDNDLNTKNDNWLEVVCYKLNIGWCGDWIVEDQFWEECDPNDSKTGYICNENCKITDIKSENDKDWDGIYDDVDLDPNIPEDVDNDLDSDGIPDINCKSWECIPGWYVKTDCDMCPCPMADFAWDIWKWDIIRAILFDKSGNYPEVVSNFYKVK